MEVNCESCGHHFEVPASMKGGMFNCPKCSKLQSAGRHWHDKIYYSCYWGGGLLGSSLGITAIVNSSVPLGIILLIITGILAAIFALAG